jgi:hypothetical protein
VAPAGAAHQALALKIGDQLPLARSSGLLLLSSGGFGRCDLHLPFDIGRRRCAEKLACGTDVRVCECYPVIGQSSCQGMALGKVVALRGEGGG